MKPVSVEPHFNEPTNAARATDRIYQELSSLGGPKVMVDNLRESLSSWAHEVGSFKAMTVTYNVKKALERGKHDTRNIGRLFSCIASAPGIATSGIDVSNLIDAFGQMSEHTYRSYEQTLSKVYWRMGEENSSRMIKRNVLEFLNGAGDGAAAAYLGAISEIASMPRYENDRELNYNISALTSERLLTRDFMNTVSWLGYTSNYVFSNLSLTESGMKPKMVFSRNLFKSENVKAFLSDKSDRVKELYVKAVCNSNCSENTVLAEATELKRLSALPEGAILGYLTAIDNVMTNNRFLRGLPGDMQEGITNALDNVSLTNCMALLSNAPEAAAGCLIYAASAVPKSGIRNHDFSNTLIDRVSRSKESVCLNTEGTIALLSTFESTQFPELQDVGNLIRFWYMTKPRDGSPHTISGKRSGDALTPLMKMSVEHPNSFKSIAQSVGELVSIKSLLDDADTDGMNYMIYLAKKGSRGEITKVSDRLRAAGPMLSDNRDTLIFIEGLRQHNIDTRERLAAISALAQLTAAGSRLSRYEIKSLVKFEPPEASETDLRSHFADIYAYVDRHAKRAKETGSDTCIDTKMIGVNLSRCIAAGMIPQIEQVIAEKKRLSNGMDLKFRTGFERKFMDALESVGVRAQYRYLMGSLDYIPKIAKLLTGLDVEGSLIDEPTRNVIDGAFPFNNKKSKWNLEELRNLLKVQLTDSSKTTEWMNSLPENASVLASMKRRGTDIDAIKRFEFRYRNFTNRADTANARMTVLGRKMQYLTEKTGISNELNLKSTNRLDAAFEFMQYAERNRLSARGGKISEIIDTAESIIKLSEMVKNGTQEIVFYCPVNPIEKMQLGVPFEKCCLGLDKSSRYGAWQRGIDANNIVMYAAEAVGEHGRGQIIGRASFVESDRGILLSSYFMHAPNVDPFGNYEGWMESMSSLATEAGRRIIMPSNMVSGIVMSDLAKTYELRYEKNIVAHIDKAVCGRVYTEFRNMENENNITVGTGGFDIHIAEAYVLEPKPKLRK